MVGAGGLIIMWRKNTIQVFLFRTATMSEEYPGVSHGESPADSAGGYENRPPDEREMRHWDLFQVRNRQVWEIAAAADEIREQRVGNAVTYVRNQNINVTNLCVNACGFCGFSKKPGDDGIYFHDKSEIQKKGVSCKNARSIRNLYGQRPTSGF